MTEQNAAFSPQEFVAQADVQVAAELPAAAGPDTQAADGDSRREIKALSAIVGQLEQMDRAGRVRVLTYLTSRFG
jgi:hypothetical protein